MANIYDVAKAARVSVATVSAVVNDSAYVSPPLKARVRRAIEQLRYNPSLVARSLARQRTGTIGMLAANIADPFWPDIVRGVEDAADARHYTLLFASSDDDAAKEGRHLQTFLAKRVDGILLTKAPGRTFPDISSQLKASRTPVVQLVRRDPAVGADAVMVDEEGCSYEAVAHLLRLGCTRIGVINALQGTTTARRYSEGYRKALKAWNLPYDPNLVMEGDFQIQSGYTAGIALLKHDPDAIFVASYLMTVGLMAALKQYQLRCPDDIAIISSDDQPWLDAFSPRLTTVTLPKYKMGQQAADTLIDRLEEGDASAHPRRATTLTLETALTIRESCGYQRRAADPLWRPVERARKQQL